MGPWLLLAAVALTVLVDGRELSSGEEEAVDEERQFCPRACCIEPLNRFAYCRNARRRCDCDDWPPVCYGSCGSGGRCKARCSSSEVQISGSCSRFGCKCCKTKPQPQCPTYGSSCGSAGSIPGTWKSSCSSTENVGEDKWCAGKRYCCCSRKITPQTCRSECVPRCRPPFGFPASGSCSNGKVCCELEPICGDHFCRDVKEEDNQD